MAKQPSQADLLKLALAGAVDELLEHMNDWDNAKLYGLLMPIIEEAIIRHTLKKCGNNISRTAKVLGISRTTIRQRLK